MAEHAFLIFFFAALAGSLVAARIQRSKMERMSGALDKSTASPAFASVLYSVLMLITATSPVIGFAVGIRLSISPRGAAIYGATGLVLLSSLPMTLLIARTQGTSFVASYWRYLQVRSGATPTAIVLGWLGVSAIAFLVAAIEVVRASSS